MNSKVPIFFTILEAEMDSIAEHLIFGDSRAAVVISIYPKLIVAAYSDELDCVAMLLFPREPFITKYNLGDIYVSKC